MKITYLLAQTDARTGVERNKDERVGGQVLVEPLVNEPVRIELQSCSESVSEILGTRSDV